MSGFVGRVGQAVQRRAARKTAASGLCLALLVVGALLVALAVLIGRELVAAGRSAWWVLRTVPALARCLALAAGVFWMLRDPWFAAPLTVALVGLLLWPRLSQGSFQARIAGPARAVAIRQAWTSLADACGLGIRQCPGWDGRRRTRTATLRRATSTADGVGTRLEVRVLPGQTPADLTDAAEKLAAATDSVDWAVTPTGPSTVTVDLVAVDVLAPVLPVTLPTEPYAATVPATVALGRCLSGDAWRLTTAAHTLTAGCTGSGKGSVMWSTIAALAPAIHAGSLRVAGIDLKGGMELGTGRALFTRLATTPADAVDLLEHLTALMTTRAGRLAGVERTHTARVGDPAWLVVVDEMAVLTAYLPDRDLRTRATRALSLLLTQGRAVGVTVWAFLQDPGKDVLALRDLFPQRVCLRMTEPTQPVMVLGDSARDAAPAHQIRPEAPGTGYARTESGTLQRVRATYVTDDQIRYLAANFPAPTDDVIDSETLPCTAPVSSDEDQPSAAVPSPTPKTPRKPRAPRTPRAPWTPRTPRSERMAS